MRIQAQNEEEAIEKAIAGCKEFINRNPIYEEQFMSFSGWNCEEERNCLGWSGVEHRCECGNRRVEWVAEELKEPGVYFLRGEAY